MGETVRHVLPSPSWGDEHRRHIAFSLNSETKKKETPDENAIHRRVKHDDGTSAQICAGMNWLDGLVWQKKALLSIVSSSSVWVARSP